MVCMLYRTWCVCYIEHGVYVMPSMVCMLCITYTCMHTYVCIGVRAHICMVITTRTYIHACMCVYMYAYTFMYVYIHTHACIHDTKLHTTYTHEYTHTHTLSLSLTHTYTPYTHAYMTHTHKHMLSRMHTDMHKKKKNKATYMGQDGAQSREAETRRALCP